MLVISCQQWKFHSRICAIKLVREFNLLQTFPLTFSFGFWRNGIIFSLIRSLTHFLTFFYFNTTIFFSFFFTHSFSIAYNSFLTSIKPAHSKLRCSLSLSLLYMNSAHWRNNSRLIHNFKDFFHVSYYLPHFFCCTLCYAVHKEVV